MTLEIRVAHPHALLACAGLRSGKLSGYPPVAFRFSVRGCAGAFEAIRLAAAKKTIKALEET
jgi:hypothetical protein